MFKSLFGSHVEEVQPPPDIEEGTPRSPRVRTAVRVANGSPGGGTLGSGPGGVINFLGDVGQVTLPL